jgi:hypothetical protein
MTIEFIRLLPCCFLAAILYLIQDSSKEAAGKKESLDYFGGKNFFYLVT